MSIDEASGPVQLEGYRGGPGPILRAVTSALDPRLERVSRQQYVKLAVVRRDARFDMCGTTGTLVLSGKDLVGATIPQALRPIRLRLYTWAGLAAGVTLSTGIVSAALRGASPYFSSTNPWLTLIWLVGVVLAAPAIGAVLRALRPRFKLGEIKPVEKYLGLGALAAFTAMSIVGLAARPRVREVEEAIARGDAVRSRVIVEALKETKGLTAEVKGAEDAVMLAEAGKVTGETRLKVLDAVASRNGARAPEAAAAARKDRLAEIRRLIDSKKPAEALAATDRWFANVWKSDAEIAEERARAHDVAGLLCTEEACRLQAANNAKATATSLDRAQRATEVRAHILEVLGSLDIAGEQVLPRLKRIRSLRGLAAKAVDVAPDDLELAEKAKATTAWAEIEQAKVAIIGSEQAVAEELLGAPSKSDGKVTWVDVEDVRVFLAIDPQKKARGLYIVGATSDARAIHGKAWTADRLLSQAIGRPTTVKKPSPDTASVSRSYDGGVPVVARWRSGSLVELRIGDANP